MTKPDRQIITNFMFDFLDVDQGTFAASIETHDLNLIRLSDSEIEMNRRLERRQAEVDDLLKAVLES
jgi:hypothetical protein